MYLLQKSKPVISEAGFSLTEILVVIAIVAIVSGAGLSVSSAIQKSTRDSQREADLRVIQGALQQYYADNNKYPNTLGGILASGGRFDSCTGYLGTCPSSSNPKVYLNNMPKDPSGSAYSYTPLYNVSSSVTCDGAQGTCHYYHLCANKEGMAAGTFCGNYNFRVTPL